MCTFFFFVDGEDVGRENVFERFSLAKERSRALKSRCVSRIGTNC